jgi:hypothetical protein
MQDVQMSKEATYVDVSKALLEMARYAEVIVQKTMNNQLRI